MSGGGWQVWSVDGENHVIPVGEDHSHTEMCWCKPTLDGEVWVHHARDRREHTVEKQ
jgi:hypothetical protein